jgi:hypothetical protein
MIDVLMASARLEICLQLLSLRGRLADAIQGHRPASLSADEFGHAATGDQAGCSGSLMEPFLSAFIRIDLRFKFFLPSPKQDPANA